MLPVYILLSSVFFSSDEDDDDSFDFEVTKNMK